MVAAIAEVNNPLTRDELVECICNINDRAKALSRRGYIGTHCDEYAKRHAEINDWLCEWEKAPA